jgi:hypothetical protein
MQLQQDTGELHHGMVLEVSNHGSPLRALRGFARDPGSCWREDTKSRREMNGLPVLVIEVPASRTPVSTPEGKYQRRAIGGKGKPECMPDLFPEMLARQADRGIQELLCPGGA